MQKNHGRSFDIEPQKVLLFGSYAMNKQTEDSDIDLLVVLDENYLPETDDDWLETKMRVRRLLRGINDDVGIDLLTAQKLVL